MTENGNGKVKQEHRLTSLEVKVDSIMTNHLPHIQKAVNLANTRTWWILATVILGIIIQIYFNTI